MRLPPAPGSNIPHVTFTGTDGQEVAYADVWQRTQLLFILLPPTAEPAWTAYRDAVVAARTDCTARETTVIVSTRPPTPAFEAPLALVADRWGEVTHAAALEAQGGTVTPDVETLLSWVDATLHRCPECEGEAL